MDYLLAAPLLFCTGLFAGFYGASVGGGALVSFPVLLLTGLPVHSAVATNRVAALTQAVSSSIKYSKEGKTDIKSALKFGTISSIAAAIGAYLTVSISEQLLSISAAILIGIMVIFILFKRNIGKKSLQKKRKANLIIYLGTFLLGIYGGFFGAGFGTILMFVFLYQGYNFVESAANSRIVGAMMSFISSIVFAISGLITYSHAIPLALGQSIRGWIGASTSIKRGNNYVRALLILVALFTMIKLGLDSIDIQDISQSIKQLLIP